MQTTLTTTPILKRPFILLILVLCVSLCLKITLVFIFYHGDHNQITQPDSHSYLYPAYTLLTEGKYEQAPGAPMFERTPGYPTFIALTQWLASNSLLPILLAQILLSSVSVLALYACGKRLFSPWVGLLAGTWVAVDYLLYSYNVMVLTESFNVLWLSLLYVSGCYFFTGAKRVWLLALSMGLCAALATLTRPINYYLIFCITAGAIVYLRYHQHTWRRCVLLGLVLLLPSIVAVGGWTLRNKILLNTYTYSDEQSIFLYNWFAATIIQRQQHVNYNTAVGILTKRLPNEGQLSPAELNHARLQAGAKILRENPSLTLYYIATGCLKLFLAPDATPIRFIIPYKEFLDLKTSLLNTPHKSLKQILYSLDSDKLKIIFIYGALFSLTIIQYGLILFAKIKTKKTIKSISASHLYLIGCIIYFIALTSNPFSYPRYRIPFQCLLDLYAAYGLSLAISWWQARKKTPSNTYAFTNTNTHFLEKP